MVDRSEYIEERYTEVDGPFLLAAAFESLAEANGALALLNRYQSRLHHEYQRLLKMLQHLQSAQRDKASA